MTVHDPAARREEYPDDPQTGGIEAAFGHFHIGLRLMSDDSKKMRGVLDAVLPRLDELNHRISELSRQVRAAEVELGNTVLSTAAGNEQQALGRHHELQRQLGTLGAAQQQVAPDHGEDAVRALIAAERQLAIVAGNAGDHVEVIDGQRSNLRDTLYGFGVRAIEPERGAAFDRDRYRSDARTIPTTDPTLGGTVAEVMTVGWERVDGTRVVELASVRVFDHRPAPVEPLPSVTAEPTVEDPPVDDLLAAGTAAAGTTAGPSGMDPTDTDPPGTDPADTDQPRSEPFVDEDGSAPSREPDPVPRPRPPQPGRHVDPNEVFDQDADISGTGRPGGLS